MNRSQAADHSPGLPVADRDHSPGLPVADRGDPAADHYRRMLHEKNGIFQTVH